MPHASTAIPLTYSRWQWYARKKVSVYRKLLPVSLLTVTPSLLPWALKGIYLTPCPLFKQASARLGGALIASASLEFTYWSAGAVSKKNNWTNNYNVRSHTAGWRQSSYRLTRCLASLQSKDTSMVGLCIFWQRESWQCRPSALGKNPHRPL